MKRMLSVIAGVLVVATVAPVSAQRQIATTAARRLATRAGSVATIQGNALNSGGALANTVVRVRDARLGRIVDQSLTDKLGAYSFKGLDPGNYVVEIVSANQTTIAATNMISVNAGETVTAIVRVPIKPSMLGRILGSQSASPATAGTDLVPRITAQLPQALVQAIAAVIPAPTPVSER